MDESELLLTLAQISVAFAGFASLATIFAQRTGQDDAVVDSGRLLNMLTTSLTVTALALIPFIPILIGLEDHWVWGTSGGVGIFAIIATLPSTMRRTAIMRQRTGFKSYRAFVCWSLLVAAIVALAGCVFDVPSGQLFTAYIFALFALVTASGILFFGVIESLAGRVGE